MKSLTVGTISVLVVSDILQCLYNNSVETANKKWGDGEDHERFCYVIRRCIQKFPDWVDNEINNKNNNENSLWSNTKGDGGKTHKTDSRNRDTTVPNGRELYHSQFSLQTDSPETFGYTLIYLCSTSFLPVRGHVKLSLCLTRHHAM
jgi:hypothetical protein